MFYLHFVHSDYFEMIIMPLDSKHYNCFLGIKNTGL